MIPYQCALILRFGLFGLVSIMLATPIDAFTYTSIHDQPVRATRFSTDTTNSNFYTLSSRRTSSSCSSSSSSSRRSRIIASAIDTGNESSTADAGPRTTSAVGLYKKYADYAVQQLLGTGYLVEDSSVPEDFVTNQAPARGAKTESIVKITTKVLIPKKGDDDDKSVVRCARITLLETVPVEPSTTGMVSTDGIQVLNFVVLPNADTTLPVLGIDMVSLPGSRHLLLLDAQPMAAPNPHEAEWESWYNKHVKDDDDENNSSHNDDEGPPLKYAWGGDFPEAVKRYVSQYALWTRLQNLPKSTNSDDDGGDIAVKTSPAVDAIQGDLFDAFQDHLDTYLGLLGNHAGDVESVIGENHQPAYLDYRRNNDPAKPMLTALYGAEWTQSILDNVLFPK